MAQCVLMLAVTMTPTFKQTYLKFRQADMAPKQALYATKTLLEWQDKQHVVVRIRAEEEVESYYDVFGMPEAYQDIHGRWHSAEQAKEEMDALLDLHGCWCTISEYQDPEGEWHVADSSGMHTGYKNVLNPFENWCVVDSMRSALDAAEAQSIACTI